MKNVRWDRSMEDEMDIFGILAMIGGLALFLYGMQVMGDGLKRTSGGRLEEILESLTSNKWKGALLGCIVTAVIQSSSATTVMVVGLVNSGIMKLTQAVGVILGAPRSHSLSYCTESIIYENIKSDYGPVCRHYLKPRQFYLNTISALHRGSSA